MLQLLLADLWTRGSRARRSLRGPTFFLSLESESARDCWSMTDAIIARKRRKCDAGELPRPLELRFFGDAHRSRVFPWLANIFCKFVKIPFFIFLLQYLRWWKNSNVALTLYRSVVRPVHIIINTSSLPRTRAFPFAYINVTLNFVKVLSILFRFPL